MDSSDPPRFVTRLQFTACLLLLSVVQATLAQWPQFGGPRRDFTCDPVQLSLVWPKDGPKPIWSRPFGEGYSGIVVDEGRIFSMYRESDEETIVCLDAETGKTIWQYRYHDPIDKAQFASRYGLGPRSTPLVSGSRVFATSFNGRLNCLDKKTGSRQWTIDFIEQFKAKLPRWGYANSAVAFEDLIVLPVGGPGAAIVAIEQATGRVRWSRHDFENSYGSPTLIEVNGQTQLTCLMAREIVGLDPRDGDLLWQHKHEGQWLNNVPNPVWSSDQTLLVTSEGEAGTRLLRLAKTGGLTRADEVWSTQKFRVVHRNLIRIGDRAYGSSGDFGPSVFSAIDVNTGVIAWQTREIARAGLLRVGDKLLMLEETGHLLLATPGKNGITVHTRAKLLDEDAWTFPALVGKRVYLRDRKTIMAVDLP